jgi:HEAT repeat protein
MFAALVSLLCCAVGCPHPDPKGGRMPDPPKELPLPEKAVPTPLDPALRAAADRELSAALQSSDPIIRVHALEAMRETDGLTHHKNEILSALSDPEPRTRFAAALAAGGLRIEEAHEPLLKIAEDPSENVRVAVRYALHRLGDSRLSHELEKLATDANPLVRGNTAMVLGLMAEPSALPILRLLAQDQQAPVRQQAYAALWQLGDEEGLKDLIGLTLSGHPDDEMVGYISLAMPRNMRVRQHIRPGLVGEDTPTGMAQQDQEKWMLAVPLVAARAMGMVGSDEGFDLARKGAKSIDPQLRMLAALAFGAIGRSDAQEALRKLLADPDPNVRVAAATGILQLKPPRKD